MVKTTMGPPLDASWGVSNNATFIHFWKKSCCSKSINKSNKMQKKNSKFLLKMDPFNTNLDLKMVCTEFCVCFYVPRAKKVEYAIF